MCLHLWGGDIQTNQKIKKSKKVIMMGYMHIDNLYKDQRILQFKECYALEKIHGT